MKYIKEDLNVFDTVIFVLTKHYEGENTKINTEISNIISKDMKDVFGTNNFKVISGESTLKIDKIKEKLDIIEEKEKIVFLILEYDDEDYRSDKPINCRFIYLNQDCSLSIIKRILDDNLVKKYNNSVYELFDKLREEEIENIIVNM